VPEERRATLLAEPTETPSGLVYRFDIHMQGERETVFFDV
jgi:protocatechuate 3,4-dioxygenase, alpha subunit